jgi:hypothetical protein
MSRESEVRAEITAAHTAIYTAIYTAITVTPVDWLAAAIGYRRRSEAWRRLAELTSDSVVWRALSLAGESDAAMARYAEERGEQR